MLKYPTVYPRREFYVKHSGDTREDNTATNSGLTGLNYDHGASETHLHTICNLSCMHMRTLLVLNWR